MKSSEVVDMIDVLRARQSANVKTRIKKIIIIILKDNKPNSKSKRDVTPIAPENPLL